MWSGMVLATAQQRMVGGNRREGREAALPDSCGRAAVKLVDGPNSQ